MFKNYLITAFRNLFRHKLYSVINIGGLLTVGGLVYRVAKNSPVHALRCE